jgi:hypothetical protein
MSTAPDRIHTEQLHGHATGEQLHTGPYPEPIELARHRWALLEAGYGIVTPGQLATLRRVFELAEAAISDTTTGTAEDRRDARTYAMARVLGTCQGTLQYYPAASTSADPT